MAIALGQRVVLVKTSPSGTGPSTTSLSLPTFFTPVQAPEAVTALAWLWSASSNDSCLAVGTSVGFIQLHSPEGNLLHRQELHDTEVTSIFMRGSGSGVDPDDAGEDVTVTFSNAVVVLHAYDIWPVVRWHTRSDLSGSWWASSVGHNPTLSPLKWDLKSPMGPRAAAVCVGPASISLSSLLAQRQDPARLLLFTAGVNPPLASYYVEESPSGGLVSLVAGLASASASALLGRAKGLIPGRKGNSSSNNNTSSTATPNSSSEKMPPPGSNHNSPGLSTPRDRMMTNMTSPSSSSTPGSNKKKRDKIPGISVSADVAVWDDKRRVVYVAMSPCCRWAACCDVLGRVLVVDVAKCMVLQMLKGYREAQAAWMVPAPGEAAFLIVYAPRRGVIEVWRPHAGVRIGSLPNAPERGVLLQQPAMPTAATGGLLHQGCWRGFQPNGCWIVDLDALQLIELTARLREVVGSAPQDGALKLTSPAQSPAEKMFEILS